MLTGLALHLGAGPLVVSVLAALPFAAQLVHLPSAWITASLGRRRVALWAVAASREIYWPLAALPFLPLSSRARLALLVAVAAISAVLSVVGNNAWTAWMGDLVPERLRGRYFGRRAAICTLGGTAASLVAGRVLDVAGLAHLEGQVFAALAAAAALSGIATTVLMARQHDVAEHPGAAGQRQPPLSAAIRQPLTDPAALRYLAYLMAWNGAVGMAAPLFPVHMLQNLKMGFLLMALQSAGVAVVRYLAAPLWGKALDRLGSRPVLVACSFGISVIPLIWLLPTPDFLWPAAIDSVFSGVLWSGHSLASFSLPLSVAPRERRPFYLAVFASASGLSFGVAAALGGGIAELLPRQLVVAGHPMFGLQQIFVASSLARLLAALLSLRVVEAGSRSTEVLLLMAGRWAGGRVARLPSGLMPRR